MSRILIAGCGDVGTALGLALCERGHEVFGARRSAQRLPAPLSPVPVDLTDCRAVERMLPAVDVVVYAVAAGRRDEGAYRRAYVDGVSTLLGVLERRAAPPRRVFFVSSTSVYGERGGAWIDEETPLRPRGFAGECLAAGERRMLASPIPATVVRLAGIYGPGRGWLIERARAGACCQGDPPRFTNRIHRDDCAGVLAHLIGRDEVDAVDEMPAGPRDGDAARRDRQHRGRGVHRGGLVCGCRVHGRPHGRTVNAACGAAACSARRYRGRCRRGVHRKAAVLAACRVRHGRSGTRSRAIPSPAHSPPP